MTAYFPCCGTPPSSKYKRRSRAVSGAGLEGDIGQPSGNSVRSTAFPFAIEWMALVSSCILGRSLNGMFPGQWPRPAAMFGPSFGDLELTRVRNHRTHCSWSRLTFHRSMPSSSLIYAELRSRFPHKFIVFRCL